MSVFIGGKDGETLALVVFKNNGLWRWSYKGWGHRETRQRDGLDNEVVRGYEWAIAESKIQVRKGFWSWCVAGHFFVGHGWDWNHH